MRKVRIISSGSKRTKTDAVSYSLCKIIPAASKSTNTLRRCKYQALSPRFLPQHIINTSAQITSVKLNLCLGKTFHVTKANWTDDSIRNTSSTEVHCFSTAASILQMRPKWGRTTIRPICQHREQLNKQDSISAKSINRSI